MRRGAQAALVGDQALREQLLAGLHVEQFELDGEPAPVRCDGADDQEIGLEQAPVLEADLRTLRRARDQVATFERSESPAQLQVARDDGSNVVRTAFGLAAERHDGDRHRIAHALGNVEAQLRMGTGRERAREHDEPGQHPGRTLRIGTRQGALKRHLHVTP